MELSLRDILGDDLLESLESEKHEQDDTDIDSFLLSALDSFERDHVTSSALYGELPRPLASSTSTCRGVRTSTRPFAAPKTVFMYASTLLQCHVV